MLWRHKRSLLLAAQTIQTCTLRFVSIHHFSSSKVSQTDTSHKFSRKNLDPVPDFLKKTRVTLTPRLVYSTLLRCRSDLVALSFFLWCARQHNYFHDRQVFDFMANVVNRLSGRYKTVRGIVRELESVGCVIKAQTFLLLLRIYWHGGMYDFVFETFEQMDRFGFTPNTFARNVIMDVLFRFGHVDTGVKVLQETLLPNFLSFNIAVCNLCKLNYLVHLKDVLRIMLRKGYVPNVGTFEMVLNCFCKKGRLKEACQVLGLMITLGVFVSVNIWSMMIDGLCRLRQADKAGLLLDKMIGTGCFPNVVTYTTLIKGFMECQMVSSALHVLNTMESRGCSYDLVLCNVLIDCFSKIGRYDDALHVFASLLKQNLVPDSFTFCSLISVVSLSKRFSILPKLADGLVIETDLVVCNSLLSYFCKAGYPSLAVEMYAEIIDRGFTADKYSFAGLLIGLCRAGRIDEAVNVYRGIVMSCPGLDAHVHTVIMDHLIRVGRCNEAIRLFRSAIVENYTLDIVSYTVAIRGLLKAGRTEEAFTLYSQIREFGLSPNAHVYSSILLAFCKERDTKMVKQLLIDITKAGIELDRNTVIRVFNFLRVMIDEEIWAPLSDKVSHIVKVDNVNNSLFEGYLKHYQFVDPSSSEDLPDVAVSVG